MAAESRMTLTFKNKIEGKNIDKGEEKNIDEKNKKIYVDFSDSIYKLYLTNRDIGISTFGRSDIKGVPISGYIESFINEELGCVNDNDKGCNDKFNKENDIENIAKMICKYFRGLDEIPNTYFHIAGYEKGDKGKMIQHIWKVDIEKDNIKRLNNSEISGAFWGGEIDILSRVIKQNGIMEGTNFKPYPFYDIPWNLFSMQDAIDFAIYAIKITEDSMRFQSRVRTVGGPIDILVIKPNGANWIQRKSLHGYVG